MTNVVKEEICELWQLYDTSSYLNSNRALFDIAHTIIASSIVFRDHQTWKKHSANVICSITEIKLFHIFQYAWKLIALSNITETKFSNDAFFQIYAEVFEMVSKEFIDDYRLAFNLPSVSDSIVRNKINSVKRSIQMVIACKLSAWNHFLFIQNL